MLCYVYQVENDVASTPLATERESKETRVHTVHALMDELDRTITKKLGPTWPSLINGHPNDHSQNPVPLLKLAIAAGVSLYVISWLKRRQEILEGRWALLEWALRPNTKHRSVIVDLPCKDLPQRPQPQHHYAETPHEEPHILNIVRDLYTPTMMPNKTLVLYPLEHGANPDQTILPMVGVHPVLQCGRFFWQLTIGLRATMRGGAH